MLKIFIILLALLQYSFSQIGFGSLQIDKVINGYKISKILFWNAGNEDITLELSIKSLPKNWQILLSKNSIELKKDVEKNFELILINKKQFKAIPIELIFLPFDNAENGKAIIEALAYKNGTNETIKVMQKAEFVYELTGKTNITKFEKSEEGYKKEIQKIDLSNLFKIFIIAILALISYKIAKKI
ncbi:MAG: hypothetical protein QXG91_04275 [Candidatus Aenigmatarchaeota archaeon]